MKTVLMILATLLLGGCFDVSDSEAVGEGYTHKSASADPAPQQQNAEQAHEQVMAEVAMKKELAQIELQKQIETGRLQQSVEMQRLELEAQQRERELLYAEQRNLMLLAALLIMVAAYGLYVLFKRRYDNKLRAYNDNLQKYFRQKEMENRMRLAEKIIDTIAEGKAEGSDRRKLIEILHGVGQEPPPEAPGSDENPPDVIDTRKLIERDPKA